MTAFGGSGRSTVVLWAVLTALCVVAVGVAVLLGLARVAPWGPVERVVVSTCETRHAGRNDYVQCDGVLPDGAPVSLRHDGRPGEGVDAVRAPWGSYVVPRTGFAAWAEALAAPLVLSLATVACVVALRKSARRTRYRPGGGLR
ncbi:hypothetical protein AB0E96_04640 [Kitasatospora sp. NPDC036755]|uniref:hypothetical protein n=1 Tax=Kitasatospora sp. NPDC036755 TaxID=3154600 RepID=UPI0033D77F80